MTKSARSKTLGGFTGLLAMVCALGCERELGEHVSGAASAVRLGSERPAVAAPVAIQTVNDVEPTPSCPERMALVPGGEAWIGADPEERFSDDESPRYLTRLAPFCLDRTEVTAAAYSACVEGRRCTPAAVSSPNCTGSNPERFDHPINCVDFDQAEAFCKARGARLPTEVEWEYAARGGPAALRYPWGNEPPDGHTCWKEPHTCRVGRFPADSFGIFDLSGGRATY